VRAIVQSTKGRPKQKLAPGWLALAEWLAPAERVVSFERHVGCAAHLRSISIEPPSERDHTSSLVGEPSEKLV
jgi:hypothetical protein